LLAQAVAAGALSNLPKQTPLMTPIETPLVFSGFNTNSLQEFGPLFQQLGIAAVQGGASGAIYTTKPAADWKDSLKPGEAVAGVLVSGDKSITGLGTVTYNDGKRVLAFGIHFQPRVRTHAHEQRAGIMVLSRRFHSRINLPMPRQLSVRCIRTGTAASWAFSAKRRR
jgi:hypothetical protein